mgnify:CR=1 FL=1
MGVQTPQRAHAFGARPRSRLDHALTTFTMMDQRPESVAHIATKLIKHRVQLRGLNRRSDLNGTEGTVLGYHAPSSCFMIQCDNGEPLRVRFESLVFLPVKPKDHAPAPTPAEPDASTSTLEPAVTYFHNLPPEEAELLHATPAIALTRWDSGDETRRELAATVRPNAKGAGVAVARRGEQRGWYQSALVGVALAIVAAWAFAYSRAG